jgi:protease-4
MNQPRQRGILVRLLRSIFMIFTGYFALLGLLVTAFVLLIGIGIYSKLKEVDKPTANSSLVVAPQVDEAIVQIKIEHGITSDSLSDRQKFFSMLFADDVPASVKDLEVALRRAADDSRIKGVFLDLENGGSDFITTTALRRALSDYQKSKKPLWVHLNEGDTMSYFLASTADKINLAPVSGITIPGPSFQLMYFGSALKKLGVELEVVRAGKYKSAMEPYVLDAPSPETLEMYGAIETHLRAILLDAVAEGRKKTRDEVEGWFKRSLFTSQQSLSGGLVDRLGYVPQFVEEIQKQVKAKNIVELDDYLSASANLDKQKNAPNMGAGAPSLALIEAKGEIVMEADGDSDSKITPAYLIKELKWDAKDDGVKAVVLRIDSPGGSALASDLIWDEVRKLAEKKPVIVSMASVAASGGYYIAAPATLIVAEPTTITGSIGVIGAAVKGLGVPEKWGVNFHLVSQSDRRSYLNFGSKSTEQDKAILGESIDETYNAFVNKVATGRKQDPAHIFAIAQGRVYTGVEASKIGLVDKLGGLTDAIREAKILAKLDPELLYPLSRYEPEDESLIDCVTGGSPLQCLREFKKGTRLKLEGLAVHPRLMSPMKHWETLESLILGSEVLAYWPGQVDWSSRKGH